MAWRKLTLDPNSGLELFYLSHPLPRIISSIFPKAFVRKHNARKEVCPKNSNSKFGKI